MIYVWIGGFIITSLILFITYLHVPFAKEELKYGILTSIIAWPIILTIWFIIFMWINFRRRKE